MTAKTTDEQSPTSRRVGADYAVAAYPAAFTAATRASSESGMLAVTVADAVSNDTSAETTPSTRSRASVTWRTQFWHDMPVTCRTVFVMRRTLLLCAALAVAGCSGSDANTSQSAASSDSHNESDVEFVQGMIPHHEQAVQMADMVVGSMVVAGEVSAELAALADQVRAAQQPEIDLMLSWLAGWGLERDPHAGHMMGSEHGMMSEDDMAGLGAANGAEFERMWLGMMIKHHEGAVAMAKDVLAAGSDPRVAALAEAVMEAQTAEITLMRQMLAAR